MMQKLIGNELKIIRIRNNLKLEEVTDSLNINRETLRRYENNANGLSVEWHKELLPKQFHIIALYNYIVGCSIK